MNTLKEPKRVKAKKEHSCDYCDKKIVIGEEHTVATYKDDYIYDWRSCDRCKAYVEEAFSNKDYDWNDGMDGKISVIICGKNIEKLLLSGGEVIKVREDMNMADIKNIKTWIQEWFADCANAVEVAKTYAEIQKENEKQLEYMLEQFIEAETKKI